MNPYFSTELVRGWKVGALALGIGLLWVGMYAMPAPDWTPATILVMSLATYLTAPWAADVFWRRDWRWMPLAVLAGWFAVDGSWLLSIDWSPAALAMRDVQIPASACLWLAFGLITRHRGDLRSLLTYRRAV